MAKIKVISITPNSPIVMDEKHAQDIEWKVANEWASQEDIEMKKAFPSINIEGWMHSKDVKKTEEIFIKNVKFKVFPTDISVRHGMEISLKMIEALRDELKKNEKIILHFHEYHSWQAYLMLMFAGNKARIICQHHGGRSPLKNLVKYKRLFLFLPLIALMQFLESLLLKRADIFYALSNDEERYLKSIGAKDIKFLTMGIGEEYFKYEDKNKARRKIGLKINKKYALFIGRIKTTKGIKEMLDAMGGSDAELLIIGAGQDKEKYEKYAQEKKIKNARFLGSVYGKDKFLYLSACDCLVLPSYTEGAPVVIMEAIARNLPIIATDVGGIQRMIDNGREGMLIKPRSSQGIARAMKNIFSWKKKDIRRYAEKYRWERIAQETYEDYLKLQDETENISNNSVL